MFYKRVTSPKSFSRLRRSLMFVEELASKVFHDFGEAALLWLSTESIQNSRYHMKRCWYILLLLLGTCSLLSGQGLEVDEAIYDALPRQSLYGDGGKSEVTALDGIYKIDLKPFCPKPQNQGRISSCTAWATGYGALSIAYAIQFQQEGKQIVPSDSAFSALFLYNQVRDSLNDCGLGTFIHKTLDLLKEKGDVQSSVYDKGNNCKRLPNAKELANAQRYRIKDWVSLFASNSANRVRIDKTKLSLADKKPVIIAMRLRNNFMELGPDSKFWLPSIGDTSLSYNHAMVVVGFDDGKGAFEVMNSWGEAWGTKGFFWIRYEDYARHTLQAFQLSLYPPGSKKTLNPVATNPKNQLSADLAVRFVKGVVDTNILFENAAFRHQQKGVYVLQGEPWPLGKLFQVSASNILGGSYLYVFSIDAAQQVNVHWPRDAKLDEKFEGLNESAVISNTNVNLVIPTPKSGLKLEKIGDEYIGILVSKDPITNLNAILQQLKTNPTLPLVDRLNKALGPAVIKPELLRYAPESIQFSTADLKGKIVPILLKIPVK